MRLARLVSVVALAACASDKTLAPPRVASVVVTSSIGTRVAVGRTTQLSAEARDESGVAIANPAVTWASTSATTASVSPAGLVAALAAGAVTIEATISGVKGSLALQARAADLDGVVATVNDTFAESLVANLTTTVRTRVEQALAQCENGALLGNFDTLDACLTAARAEVAAATDPTDRALLASLSLYLDRIQTLMNL
jgi:hypothetical protein